MTEVDHNLTTRGPGETIVRARALGEFTADEVMVDAHESMRPPPRRR